MRLGRAWRREAHATTLPVTAPANHLTHHVVNRARERLGVQITRADARRVILDITDTLLGTRSAALLLRQQGEHREVWLVRLAGRPARIVYDRRVVKIITVLTGPLPVKVPPDLVVSQFEFPIL